MSAAIVFRDLANHVECHYRGPFELTPLMELAREIARYCGESGQDRVLVDVSDSVGELDVLARFEHGSSMAIIWPATLHVVLLGRADQVLPDRFWENVTNNRGLATRVTTDRGEALAWLREIT